MKKMNAQAARQANGGECWACRSNINSVFLRKTGIYRGYDYYRRDYYTCQLYTCRLCGEEYEGRRTYSDPCPGSGR